LFKKSAVLSDTFFVRQQAGEQLVKIQKSNIGYTKEEIQRVLELSCYREHRQRLDVEPKPVLEELKPQVIDGSTQTEMLTDAKETQTTEAETAVPIANVSTIPPSRPPPPVTHLALAPCSCHSPTPAHTQNDTTATAGKALTS